jgi:hypothetical protein
MDVSWTKLSVPGVFGNPIEANEEKLLAEKKFQLDTLEKECSK